MAETAQTAQTVKTKRIRWLGKAEGVVRSVLNLSHPDGMKTYFPGDIIDDAAHLAALGEARIQELIAEGKAEAVKFVEGVLNIVKDIPSDMSDEEKKRAQAIASGASTFQKSLAKGNESLKKNLEKSVEKPSSEPAPAFIPAGPSRSGT